MTSKKAKAAEFFDETYRIQVTGRHVSVTEAMKQYAIDKVSKIERFHPRLIDVVVTMDIQKIEHRVDIVLKVDHIMIKGHAITNDMYVSIDKAVAKIERQLRRYKQRIQDHTAKSHKLVDMKVNVLKSPWEEELDEMNLDIELQNQRELEESLKPHEIVSEDTMLLKQLTYDEAVMKMELSQESFMIFRNEADQKLRIIYRREDGNYGVVEPE